MTLLSDSKLKALVASEQAVTSPNGPDSILVEPASIDFRIGRIIVPGSPDATGTPKQFHTLHQGATAAVLTLEQFKLPAGIGAITFPPSRVAFRGLLVTNPGHIDPGYEGPMRFMVINMGRDPYELRVGDAIATVMLFRTEEDAAKPYENSKVVADFVPPMSPDFLDITSRAEEAAKEAVSSVRKSVIGWVAGAFLVPYMAVVLLFRPASQVYCGLPARAGREDHRVHSRRPDAALPHRRQQVRRRIGVVDRRACAAF